MGFAAADWATTARGFPAADRSATATGLSAAYRPATAGRLAADARCTPAGRRATLRRPVPGSPVARSGAVNGSATMGPTASGIAVDRARAVDGPAVAWAAGGPAGPVARIGPWPLPWRGLVGWRRMRRGDVDRRRLGRR
jgi:hypothetical protein